MDKIRQGGFLISKIHQLSGRLLAKKLKAWNVEEINPAQGRILFFLWQNDGISIQEVSRMTSLEKSTLTSMLDRLEASGHIRRVPSMEDRRKILIEVADKDTSLKASYERATREMSEIIYKDFTEQEKDIFESYLHRIYANLSSHKSEEER